LEEALEALEERGLKSLGSECVSRSSALISAAPLQVNVLRQESRAISGSRTGEHATPWRHLSVMHGSFYEV